MYHRIADDSFDPWGLCVPPTRFSEHMNWLAENRTVLDLGEFARLHQRGSLPGTAVAITFDDGYSSVASDALPLLDQLGLHATIFIPASLVESQSGFWWDDLARSIVAFSEDRIVLAGKDVPLGPEQPGDRHWSPGAPPATRRQQVLHDIWSRIRTWPLDRIEAVLGEVRGQTGETAQLSADRLMSRTDVRGAASDRVKIGSHALTHSSLPALGSDERAKEIRGSVPACEAMTGERPQSFAYPFGEYDHEIERLVDSSGFACAVTTDHGPVTAKSRATALPRVGVGNWPLNLFKRVLLEL